MYRKPPAEDGKHRSVSNKHDRDGNRGFFSCDDTRSSSFSERSSSAYGPDSRRRDYSYKGRSFVNSNWRRPQPSQPMGGTPSSTNRTQSQSSSAIMKRNSAVDNLIPHFCVKSSDNPPTQVIQSPTPLVRCLEGKNSPEKEKGQGVVEDAIAQAISNLEKPCEVGTWRTSGNTPGENHSSVPWNIRRKLMYNMELDDIEIKSLSHPESLHIMLKSRYVLNEVIVKLDQETKRVELEEHVREEIAREHLEEEMKPLYENCKVIPYSTRVLGMARSQCSLYLFFDAGNSYHGNVAHDKVVQNTIRKNVYERMCECSHCEQVRNWDIQELVTFEHVDSQMKCVVSVDNGIKHRNTLLIRTFITLDKRVRLLMLIVTDMVYRYHCLSKFFTPYILQVMTIMYLQRMPDALLPTLEILRKTLPCERIFIKGFDCSFPYDVSQFPRSQNIQSVEELLFGFCTYYLNFNWDEDVISVLGPDLKRSMFRNPHEVPTHLEPPLSSYFQSLCWDDHVSSMNCNLPIVVQDPLELGVNVAEQVTSTALRIFKMMCSDSIDMLLKWL